MNVLRSLLFGAVGLVVAALLAIALVGCPGPTFVVQQYRGPQRPRETVSILRVNGGEPVRLLYLDGEDVAAPLEEDGRLHIEMLPGRHTVVVGNASAPSERYAPIAFQADAGKVYRVAFVAGAGGDAHVYEVDAGKDTILRDVTLAPEATEGGARAPKPKVTPRQEDAASAPREPSLAPTPTADAG